MYGLIVKLTLQPGKREEASALLCDSSANMPGCFSYVVARDAADENVLWVTEVWESRGEPRRVADAACGTGSDA